MTDILERVAALLNDADRLNFLETGVERRVSQMIIFNPDSGWTIHTDEGGLIGTFTTLREAIDAAMAR